MSNTKAKRGRKPKTGLVSTRTQQRRKAAARVSAPEGAVTPPSWLSRGATKVWEELQPAFKPLSLRPVDRFPLARYCELSAQYINLTADVVANGHTTVIHGEERRRPESTALLRIEPLLLQLENALGLNPKARTRISKLPAPDTTKEAEHERLDAKFGTGRVVPFRGKPNEDVTSKNVSKK